MDGDAKPACQAPSVRKIYCSPVLIVYGDVRRLTSGGGGVMMNDLGVVGANTRPCWIAEVLYGVDSPRVILVRAWLSRCFERNVWWALAVVPLYVRFGRKVAFATSRSPFLQRILRPVFDRAVRGAYSEYAATAFARGVAG